jgi:hypothetical protein
VQDDLRVSLVVISPPQLQIDLQNPVPSLVPLGETVFVGLDITNNGDSTVDLTTITLEAENGEVVEGASTFVGPLTTGNDTSYSGVVIPSEVGPMELTLTINYIDDLSNEQTIVETYELVVTDPPPTPDIPDRPFDPLPLPEVPEETDNSDLFGRLLLGLLGLGS